jgi:iron complex transport system ATP-binding protein
VIRLEATGLAFDAGGRRILQPLDLAAAGGEFVAVIGPNGAGKSTLLKLLAGLAAPSTGEVRLDGQPLRGVAPRDLARRRSYLPQNPRCEWPLPVHRLVALGLTPGSAALGGMDAAAGARIDAALGSCDLLARRDQAATTLSGGELARAMLARALVSDPALLIVDEPLAGLDPRHALDAAQRLQRLASEEGRLVIAAMHDFNIVLRRASRVWALKDGRMVADDAPAAVMNAALLREVFEIDARIAGSGAQTFVDSVG